MSEVEPKPKRQCVIRGGVCFLYSTASFITLRGLKGFYIDNTRYIRVLHVQCHDRAFLHRPPRFGKSLFLSTLEAYYDKSINKETRAMLFDGLDVLKDPVPGAGQYYILRWDFGERTEITGDPSGLEKVQGISDRLLAVINYSIIKFAMKYGFQHYFASNRSVILGEKRNNLDIKILIDEQDALASFRHLCTVMDMNNMPLFLLIDEYDHFANKLLFENPHGAYQKAAVRESAKRALSILQAIFETIKSAASSIKSTNVLPFRVLAVGLNPMDLSVNDVEDISHKISLAGIIGFRVEDLKFAIELLSSAGRVSEEEALPLLGIMEEYFDGYRFHEQQVERIYNPQLCLHLLKDLWTGDISAAKIISCSCKPLQSMMVKDDNVDLCDNVFDFLAVNPYYDSLMAQLKTYTPTLLQSTIRSKLKMKDLLSVEDQTPDFLLSLMYYHGMVTLSPFANAVKIPNKLAEIQYLYRIEKDIHSTIEKFIRTLQASDLQVVIQSVIGLMGTMDESFKIFSKGHLKAVLLGLFLPHGNRVLSLFGQPEADGGKCRSYLMLVLKDGREAVIKFKSLMPHHLILPVKQDHLNTTHIYLTEKKNEEDWEPEVKRAYLFHLANESKDITRFWNMNVKREVYTLFQTSFLNGTEEIQIKGVEEAEDREYLENYPLKKRDSEKESFKTAGDYINSADKQVAQYGHTHFKQILSGPRARVTPVLFVVSSFWTTHLVVKQAPLDPNYDSNRPE